MKEIRKENISHVCSIFKEFGQSLLTKTWTSQETKEIRCDKSQILENKTDKNKKYEDKKEEGAQGKESAARTGEEDVEQGEESAGRTGEEDVERGEESDRTARRSCWEEKTTKEKDLDEED